MGLSKKLAVLALCCGIGAAALWLLAPPTPAQVIEQGLHTTCLAGADCADKAKILKMIDTLASQLEKRGSSPVQSPSAPHQSPSAPLAEEAAPSSPVQSCLMGCWSFHIRWHHLFHFL